MFGGKGTLSGRDKQKKVCQSLWGILKAAAARKFNNKKTKINRKRGFGKKQKVRGSKNPP